jgi:uncharacterized protein YaaW (UPF0174 family)
VVRISTMFNLHTQDTLNEFRHLIFKSIQSFIKIGNMSYMYIIKHMILLGGFSGLGRTILCLTEARFAVVP